MFFPILHHHTLKYHPEIGFLLACLRDDQDFVFVLKFHQSNNQLHLNNLIRAVWAALPQLSLSSRKGCQATAAEHHEKCLLQQNLPDESFITLIKQQVKDSTFKQFSFEPQLAKSISLLKIVSVRYDKLHAREMNANHRQ